MAILINDNYSLSANKPFDARYLNISTPWVDVSEAIAGIPTYRYIGLTVNIAGTEYWWKDGVGDGDLVEKTNSGGTITGGTNGLSTSGADIVLGGDLTGNTTINLNNSELQISTSGLTPSLIGIDPTGIIISTSGSSVTIDNNEGLIYGDSYTSSNPNWIPTKLYVDGIAIGLNVHDSVLVATTTNITLSGLTTIDGILLQNGDRVLVKNQTNGADNGIYIASASTWNRSDDYNFSPAGEIANGDLIPVVSGDTLYNSLWAQTSNNPIVSGNTLIFTLFSKPNVYIGGIGIDISGNTIDINGSSLVGNSLLWTGNTFNVDTTTGTLSTALSNKLNISDFETYTGTTQPVIDAAVTGITGVGTGTTLYSGTTGINGRNIILNSITGSGDTVVQKIDDEIIIFSSSDATSNLTGATNGLSLFNTGTYIGLGGELTQDTTICGGYSFNLGNVSSGLTAISAVTPTFHVQSSNGNSCMNFSHDEDEPRYDVCLYGANADSNASIILDVDVNNGCFIANTAPNIICNSNLSLCTTDNNTKIFNVDSTNSILRYNNEAWISASCKMSCESITDIGNSALNIKSVINYEDRSHNFIKDDSIILSVLSGGTARYGSNVTLNNDCDLAHKWYVDNATGNIGADNGLTRSGDNIVLGGSLTGDTCIDGNTGNYGLTLSGITQFCVDSQLGNVNVISLSAPSSQIFMNGCNVCGVLGGGRMCLVDNTSTTQIELDVGGDTRFCNLNAKTTETNLLYINSSTGQIVSGDTINSTTANNGLIENNSIISLGGDLTGNTTINGVSTYNMLFSNLNDYSTYSSTNTICASTSALLRTPSFTLHDGVNNVMLITSSCKILTDATNSEGFVYAADYSATSSTNPRWIPDNAYVTGLTSGNIGTASNGLCKIGSDIKLGGTLCENTDICLGGGTAYSFSIKNSGITTNSIAEFISTGINLCATNINSPFESGKLINNFNNTSLSNGYTNCYSEISLAKSLLGITICGGASNASFTVTDATSTPRGIEYAGDYSGTFSNCSLITKEFNDNCALITLNSGKTYTDNCATTVLNSANTYTDNCATIVLSSANTYTDNCATIVLSSANTYTDNCATTVLNSANTYTDNCATIVLSSANTYTDNCATIVLSSANTYTDNCATTVLNSANTYTDNCALITLNSGKTYTDNCVAEAITGATNGLTKTGQDVKLGGCLTEDSSLLGDGYDFYIGTSTRRLDIFQTNSSGATTFNVGTADTNVNRSVINMLDYGLGISFVNSGNTQSTISINNDNMLVTDAINSKGLVYANNYINNFDNCSLITKEYVDNKANVANVCVIDNTYTTLRNDEIIAVSGLSTNEISLYATPVLGQRLTVVDICGNALADPIIVNGNGNNINDGICSSINTDYGSITYVYNGFFWSAVAFIN